MKQRLIEAKVDIDQITNMIGNSDIFLSIINKSSREKFAE